MVERHLARALVSTGNLSEVATYMVRRGSDAEEVSELLKELALETAVFDEEQAWIVGTAPEPGIAGLWGRL